LCGNHVLERVRLALSLGLAAGGPFGALLLLYPLLPLAKQLRVKKMRVALAQATAQRIVDHRFSLGFR